MFWLLEPREEEVKGVLVDLAVWDAELLHLVGEGDSIVEEIGVVGLPRQADEMNLEDEALLARSLRFCYRLRETTTRRHLLCRALGS